MKGTQREEHTDHDALLRRCLPSVPADLRELLARPTPRQTGDAAFAAAVRRHLGRVPLALTVATVWTVVASVALGFWTVDPGGRPFLSTSIPGVLLGLMLMASLLYELVRRRRVMTRLLQEGQPVAMVPLDVHEEASDGRGHTVTGLFTDETGGVWRARVVCEPGPVRSCALDAPMLLIHRPDVAPVAFYMDTLGRLTVGRAEPAPQWREHYEALAEMLRG